MTGVLLIQKRTFVITQAFHYFNRLDKKCSTYIAPKSHVSWRFTFACLFTGGIRCGELGGVMHGKDPETTENGDEFEEGNRELLRLAIPRRTYTESHMKWVY